MLKLLFPKKIIEVEHGYILKGNDPIGVTPIFDGSPWLWEEVYENLTSLCFLRKPDVHIFGHTHFGWDMVLDGTRYVQVPG